MSTTRIKSDYSITNLVDYIKIFEILREDPYSESIEPTFYRGEATNYYSDNNPVFNASGFRKNPVPGYEINYKYPFQIELDMFRNEVWNEINGDTRKQFLAYGQHHGISTNLIDFTDNPLVALFFAAQDTESDFGYVYLYKTPVLDITSLFKSNDEVNILEILISNDNQTVEELIKFFWGFGAGSSLNFTNKYCKLIAQDFLRLFHKDDIITIDPVTDNKVLNETIVKAIGTENNEILKQEFEELRNTRQAGLYYLILLRAFLRLEKSKFEPTVYNLSGIMPMVYRPIMNFKRGVNQNGLFLYQNYMLSKGNFLVARQKIKPTTIIEITNKEIILGSLDRLNINSKFIYGDHSNVAKYIVSKFDEIREMQKELSIHE